MSDARMCMTDEVSPTPLSCIFLLDNSVLVFGIDGTNQGYSSKSGPHRGDKVQSLGSELSFKDKTKRTLKERLNSEC